MESLADAHLRLNLAEGHLREGLEELDLGRWRPAAAGAQQCAENAAKAAIALHEPVPQLHDMEGPLRALSARVGRGPEQDTLSQLATLVSGMGTRLLAELRYGDEEASLTPWQLFSEDRARSLVAAAHSALDLARRLVELRKAQM